MGLLDTLGLGDFFGGINFGTLLTWGSIIIIAIGVFALAAAIIFGFSLRKAKKLAYKTQIPIFQIINGKYYRIAIDKAKELFVPDTNVSLFHLKSKGIYIARPTRWMGKDECWYVISPNGEWINFDLSTDPEKVSVADIDYDHRDTRYAYVNLKEIIKRNYKDKGTKWWKEHAPLITFVIISFIFIGGMWIITSQVGNLISQLGPMLDRQDVIAAKLIKAVEIAQNLNSGVTSAG